MTATAEQLLDGLRAPLRARALALGEAHLNNAGVAPMCDAARDAGHRVLARLQGGSLAVGDLLAEYEAARGSYARLVGCDADDVSYFQTCAAAINQVAMGMQLGPGDELVRWDQEYPSNAYPWHRAAERAGGRVVVVPSSADLALDTARLVDAITARTRAVAVSWVQYQTGAVTDLAPVVQRAHEVGAWVVVDAIQGLGVMPFDMRALGVDAVCGGTHKWLLGPVGHGFLALAKGRRPELTPLFHGAITYGTPDDRVDAAKAARTDQRRFEPGTPLFLGAITGAAAIDVLCAIGVDRVGHEAMAIARQVEAAAHARGFRVLSRGASPITSFVPRGDVDQWCARLKQAGVSVAQRAGAVRVSPHAHNEAGDVDRLFAVLDT